ncbi:Uncharacterised protein [Chlamydia trachomatis]|nr:Uncharacterised protein [Chlamydia trachomatis]
MSDGEGGVVFKFLYLNFSTFPSTAVRMIVCVVTTFTTAITMPFSALSMSGLLDPCSRIPYFRFLGGDEMAPAPEAPQAVSGTASWRMKVEDTHIQAIDPQAWRDPEELRLKDVIKEAGEMA